MRQTNRISILSVTALFALMVHPILAQQGTGQTSNGRQSTTPQLPSLTPIAPEGDGMPPDLAARQNRMRSTDRQKQIVLDTQKLVALANELKVDVDKSDKDTMSLDVIRKAEEIEKLAHAVKEKMKGE